MFGLSTIKQGYWTEKGMYSLKQPISFLKCCCGPLMMYIKTFNRHSTIDQAVGH